MRHVAAMTALPKAAAIGLMLAGTATILLWTAPVPPRPEVVPRGPVPTGEWSEIPPLPPLPPASMAAPATAHPPTKAKVAPSALPTIAEADFRRAVNARMGEVERCYRSRFPDRLGRPGRIAVRIEIDATGQVSDSTPVTDTVRDPQVAACVAEAVRRARFPAPGMPIHYTFPFVFQPGS
jgi:hypothetical protein